MATFVLFSGSFAALAVPSRAYALNNQVIITLTNKERVAANLPPMAWNAALSSSASQKAQDMCNKGYWSHTGPDGSTAWTFIGQAGYGFSTAGENLAKGSRIDAEVIAAWMGSPSHRVNILKAEFVDVGISSLDCSFQGVDTTVVVAHYGAPKKASARPAAKQAAPANPKPAPKPQTPAQPEAPQTPAAPAAPVSEPAPEPQQPAPPVAQTDTNQDVNVWQLIKMHNIRLVFGRFGF